MSFQTAWLDTMPRAQRAQVIIRVKPVFSEDASPVLAQSLGVRVFHVGLVPANMPAPADPDDGYFTVDPTLLPDILEPVQLQEGADFTASAQSAHRGWNSLWWDLTAIPGLAALEVQGSVRNRRGHDLEDREEVLWRERISVRVRATKLSAPKLTNVQWFHADSLANYYGVEPWTEPHWRVVQAHMESCARMRVNTVLTPVWTPPLDIAPGVYRRNVQLLGIRQTSGGYEFDFSRLERWIALLKSSGLTGVEIPHLFTQWGAEHTPRFWIEDEDGQLGPRFGWDTPATSGEYKEFLEELIPALRGFLDAQVGEDHVWYHVSDEPEAEHVESYRAARGVVAHLLEGAQMIDALGDPDFQPLVETPVVATNMIPRFRAEGIEPEWVYYCVAQDEGVANRFLAQRPNRHRMLGFQLFKAGAQGFLHWAFNFYNTQYSLRALDPYRDTSAGGGFISGDTFVVYPAADGTVRESIRHRMLRAAFDDLAVCQLAEKIAGRDAVLAIIDPDGTLDYNAGWVSEEEVLRRRASLDDLL
ncbi:MAG: DUF4091 domain-containing protein [Actinomycetaceae bacterium]|nr:DUF4091 domain-containing protein [Actinomycetaceae bacterium]